MSQKTTEILERLQREPIVRTFVIDRASADDDSRTVRIAIASDKPIDHWFGQLELSMDKKAIRTERMDEIGIPLLMGHDSNRQVGIIENYSIDMDGMLRGDARFDTHQLALDAYNSVKNNILRGVSVGAMIHKMDLRSKGKDSPDIYRSEDWEPYEASLTPIPKDTAAGVGRSLETESADLRAAAARLRESAMSDIAEAAKTLQVSLALQRANSTTEKTMEPTEQTPATPAVEITTRSAELVIADEIREWGKNLQADQLATSYLRDQKIAGKEITVRGFMDAVKAAQPAAAAVPVMAPEVAAERAGVKVELARSIPRYGRISNFKGAGAEERAYRFGQWLLGRALFDANFAPCVAARTFCQENGLIVRAMGESVNETGGYTVPPEFGNDLIDLREQFGVFRRNAKVVPMSSDTRTDPRRVSGLTAYFVAEAGSITASDMGWDQVSLVAKKLAVLARYSSEVNEDSILNFGDTLAGEIAYAFAEKEDRCGFLGDGTSTYGGMTGVTQKLLGLSATRADIAGLQVAAGNAFSEVTLANFEEVVAKLPQYADTEAAAWFVHRSFYWNVMVRVMLAAGGVTASEIEDARRQRFMGYRVEFSQVMPNVEANDTVVALLGDLSKAASFGTRRDTQIAFSEHSRFANDEIEIRGTERFDINVHSVGNSSGTAALRVPGPVVGLLLAAA